MLQSSHRRHAGVISPLVQDQDATLSTSKAKILRPLQPSPRPRDLIWIIWCRACKNHLHSPGKRDCSALMISQLTSRNFLTRIRTGIFNMLDCLRYRIHFIYRTSTNRPMHCECFLEQHAALAVKLFHYSERAGRGEKVGKGGRGLSPTPGNKPFDNG
jgi:hypothetical protein